MDMERGALAMIDHKLLAGLDEDEALRTVRMPAAAAKWSIWKRYCDSVGISMGRAVIMLIDRELISVFDPQHATIRIDRCCYMLIGVGIHTTNNTPYH